MARRKWRGPWPQPPTIGQLTEEMLAPVRRVAEESGLPQTVWPSKFYGPEFVGVDCLLTSMAAVMVDFDVRGGVVKPPFHAAEGSEPLLTLIPSRYFDQVEEWGAR